MKLLCLSTCCIFEYYTHTDRIQFNTYRYDMIEILTSENSIMENEIEDKYL